MDSPNVNLAHVPLQNHLQFVPIFKDGFEELTREQKSIIRIDNKPLDISQICLNVHIYKSESEVILLPHNITTDNSPPRHP